MIDIRGKISTFGGPEDLGISPSEGLALFEAEDLGAPIAEGLFLQSQPSGTTGLGRRLDPNAMYVACRWDYQQTSRSSLRNRTVKITNISGSKSVEARPADWGPSERTGRSIDLSPAAASALGLDTDDEAIVYLTQQEATNVAQTPPRIYSTSEWQAMAARASFATAPAMGIVIHNTEGQNRPALTGDAELAKAFEVARQIQRGHMIVDHNWSDTGQHFTISRGGLVLEGRHGSYLNATHGLVVRGAHAGDDVYNKFWFGIEVEGNFVSDYKVTDQQWKSLVELGAWLSKWAGKKLPIVGHKDIHETDCPGKLYGRLGQLRAEVWSRFSEL